MDARPLLPALLLGAASSGCIVQQHCYTDEDCTDGRICSASGSCIYECTRDEDCGSPPWRCEEHRCRLDCDPTASLECPEGMVPVCGAFCMDAYEASRPDATASSPGTDSSHATSRAGVLPWYETDASLMNQQVAEAACEAAGKRLCTPAEWELACRGPEGLEYCYGNTYEPTTCNGIDTFCSCEGEPYPHCYEDCGADFHVVPTGTFADCTDAFGIFDLNGNVWEVVQADDGLDHYRGGAFNCRDSETLHACGYEATWDPSAKGFRCCADGVRR